MKDVILTVNTIDDLDEILRVANEIFQPNLQEKEKYFNKSDWADRTINGFCISALVDDKVVGFSISYGKEKDLHIWNVGVLDKYRKMGIWHKLYEKTIEHAIKNNFRSISLNTYKEKFPDMYNFCQKEGFVEYKTEIDSLSGKNKSKFVKKL